MRSKRTSDDFLDPPGLLLVLPLNKLNLDFLKKKNFLPDLFFIKKKAWAIFITNYVTKKKFTRISNTVRALYTLLYMYIYRVLFQFVV